MATADSPAQTSRTLKQELQCGICHEQMTFPKKLPCGHTFCLNCLRGLSQGMVSSAVLYCQHCGQVCDFDLEDDQDANNLLQVLQEAECYECRRSGDLQFCGQCEQPLCPTCYALHSGETTELRSLLDTMVEPFVNDTSHTGKRIASLRKSVDRSIEEERKAEEAFCRALETLKRKKQSVLLRYKASIAFQKSLILRLTEDTVGERHEMCSLAVLGQKMGLQEEWEEMKQNTDVLESIASGSALKFDFDFAMIKEFGEILIETESIEDTGNNGTVETQESATTLPDLLNRTMITASQNESNRPRSDGSCGRPDFVNNVLSFPNHVNYRGKHDDTRRTIIEHNPHAGPLNLTQAGKLKKILHSNKFKPKFAQYYNRENAIYCLSKGEVLKYGIETARWECVCDSIKVKAMTLSDCEKLFVTDGKSLVSINLILPQENRMHNKFTDAVQICSHDKQFAVLDAGRKLIMQYSENGFFITDIMTPEDVDSTSLMCVDRNGMIYLTGGVEVTRQESGNLICEPCGLGTSVIIKTSFSLYCFRWDGTRMRDLETTIIKNLMYDRDEHHCPKSSIRKKKSEKRLPSDAEFGPGGICIDGDGYITITIPGTNEIKVMSKGGDIRNHCVYGGREVDEFRGPTGVSLMADGRMVVCDTRNYRLKIL